MNMFLQKSNIFFKNQKNQRVLKKQIERQFEKQIERQFERQFEGSLQRELRLDIISLIPIERERAPKNLSKK
jgi:hypothetical protein